MDDLEAAVAARTAQIEAARRARLRAEGERDAALAAAENARARLAAEFGVRTVEQAAAVREQLQAQLREQIATLDSELAAARA